MIDEYEVFPSVGAVSVWADSGDLYIKQAGVGGDDEAIVLIPAALVHLFVDAIQEAAKGY